MATINLASKYSTKLDERFTLSSRTDAYTGNDYDFEGVNTVKIYSIEGTSLNDYNRSASTDRFGTTTEIGDFTQTMVLTKDKGFSRSIDYGNAGQQYNIKRAQDVLKNIWDETMVPTIDKYRFNAWVNGAANGILVSAAPTKTTIIESIMNGSAALSNVFVPLENRVLFVRETIYIACKLASELTAIDSTGAQSITRGVVGELDGMPVVRVPDSYFPTGVNFIIKTKNSTVDPITLKTLRVQKAPKGYDADVLEGRVIYDSFVIGNKAYGIYVNALTANMTALPALDNGVTTSGKVTITCATAGSTIKYTTDGTNPKTSDSVTTYSAAFTTPAAGTVIKACASATGYINSPIASLTI